MRQLPQGYFPVKSDGGKHQRYIAVDIDDTLAATATAVTLQILAEFPGISHVSARQLTQQFGQPSNIPDFSALIIQQRIASLLNDLDFLRSLPIQPDVVPAIHDVHALHPIGCYITSRTHNQHDVTRKWLQAHDLPPAPLVTRLDTVREVDWKMRYLTLCRPDIGVLIDDNPDAYSPLHAIDFIWLQRSDHNTDRQIPHVYRHWNEIVHWGKASFRTTGR